MAALIKIIHHNYPILHCIQAQQTTIETFVITNVCYESRDSRINVISKVGYLYLRER